MAEVLLAAFNGQLDLRVAYDYNRNEIYEFLDNVTANHADYGVPDDQVDELTAIADELRRLSLPDGTDFRAGDPLRPDQHIYRTRNPAWPANNRPPAPVTISKFAVARHPHLNLDYWSPYDLLGLFLSSGPAPEGATKRNFYLPLTAVYGRWCRQIAGDRVDNGVGNPPFMFQCTWTERADHPTPFSLGSSLEGAVWPRYSTGTWQTVLKGARFELLDGPETRLQHAGWSFENSPSRENNGAAGTRFGNCAETYPFLRLLVGHDHTQEACYGLALSREYIETDHYQDDVAGVVWTNLWNPCANCKALITLCGGQIDNFHRNNGRE